MRVLIADDHPLFRDGLARAISARFELVAQVADGRAALEQIRTLQPDVAVLDLRMPGLSGLQVAARVNTRVLILSAATDSALVYAAVAAGAAGYWSKEADRNTICDAIAAVARGEQVLDPSLQSGLFGEIQAREVDSERPVLSERELDILDRVAASGGGTHHRADGGCLAGRREASRSGGGQSGGANPGRGRENHRDGHPGF